MLHIAASDLGQHYLHLSPKRVSVLKSVKFNGSQSVHTCQMCMLFKQVLLMTFLYNIKFMVSLISQLKFVARFSVSFKKKLHKKNQVKLFICQRQIVTCFFLLLLFSCYVRPAH